MRERWKKTADMALGAVVCGNCVLQRAAARKTGRRSLELKAVLTKRLLEGVFEDAHPFINLLVSDYKRDEHA